MQHKTEGLQHMVEHTSDPSDKTAFTLLLSVLPYT